MQVSNPAFHSANVVFDSVCCCLCTGINCIISQSFILLMFPHDLQRKLLAAVVDYLADDEFFSTWHQQHKRKQWNCARGSISAAYSHSLCGLLETVFSPPKGTFKSKNITHNNYVFNLKIEFVTRGLLFKSQGTKMSCSCHRSPLLVTTFHQHLDQSPLRGQLTTEELGLVIRPCSRIHS